MLQLLLLRLVLRLLLLAAWLHIMRRCPAPLGYRLSDANHTAAVDGLMLGSASDSRLHGGCVGAAVGARLLLLDVAGGCILQGPALPCASSRSCGFVPVLLLLLLLVAVQCGATGGNGQPRHLQVHQ